MAKKKQPVLENNSVESVYTKESHINAAEFAHVGTDDRGMETIARPSVSFWKDAFSRLARSKVAVFCFAILSVMILGAIFLPMISPFNFSEQNVAFSNMSSGWMDDVTGQMHIFGTDALGRDIWVRIWMGARVSLTVAFAVTIIDCIVGIIYGGISGYFSGAVDNVMMRIVEIISGIPYLIIVMLLLIVLPRGITTIIIAYSITGWTNMARLVRGQVLSLREQEFLIAAESMGAKPSHIIARHLVPNLLSLIVVNVTLDIPNVIFTEAFLSMLSLGIAPPNSSWGTMAYDGITVFQMYPMQLVYPALFISLTMLAFNLLGDQMRDAFDPKLRR